MAIELSASNLDLRGIVRPGDHVFLGQGTAEPLTLSETLVRQRAELGPLALFLGVVYSDTLQAEHADFLSFSSYGAFGTAQRLAKAGLLDVLPCHYSHLPELLRRRELRCDVVCLQLSAVDSTGAFSLGVANDYMLEAARQARVVIAEVNEQAPWTYGSDQLASTPIHYLVRTSRPLLEVKTQPLGEIEHRIGAHAAPYISDGAVLETGIGAIPDAILAALRGHRDLGVHSGMLGDSIIDLIEAGVVTNRLKPIDTGISVCGLLLGTQRLYRYAHQNPGIRLSPSWFTHRAAVMANFQKFVAINSALEVDISGQVNAEVTNGRYVGAIGGQGDFVRAANASPQGRSIIALPSTAKGGSISRIVVRFADGVTTTPRSDADLVVTEWGVAELRGQALAERARRMIAIAHPAFREQLERDFHALSRKSAA
ncbi:MAG: acetyl-CoA hydrolase/transferase C-terminal domain-containing protein [Sterolibacterium sp.]